MTYRARILELMRDCECDTVTPAAVEAWMRVAHPTLDALSADEFRDAADNALQRARVYRAAQGTSLGSGAHRRAWHARRGTVD